MAASPEYGYRLKAAYSTNLMTRPPTEAAFYRLLQRLCTEQDSAQPTVIAARSAALGTAVFIGAGRAVGQETRSARPVVRGLTHAMARATTLTMMRIAAPIAASAMLVH